MFPSPYGVQWNWGQGFWHISLQRVKCVITVFTEVLFHHTPKKLNRVEFTMKFWEENRQVTSFLNYFMNKRLLFLEVGLKLEDVLAATSLQIGVAFFALSTEIMDIKPTLKEHIFNTLWLTRELWMISRINHWLRHFCTSAFTTWDKPAISWVSLFPTWVDIHLCDQQGIFRISRVALRVVNHYQCLVTGSMFPLKGRNDLFTQLFSCNSVDLACEFLWETNTPASQTVPWSSTHHSFCHIPDSGLHPLATQLSSKLHHSGEFLGLLPFSEVSAGHALTISAVPAFVVVPVSSLIVHDIQGFGLLWFFATFWLLSESGKSFRMVRASPALQPLPSVSPSVPHHTWTAPHLNPTLCHPQAPTVQTRHQNQWNCQPLHCCTHTRICQSHQEWGLLVFEWEGGFLTWHLIFLSWQLKHLKQQLEDVCVSFWAFGREREWNKINT